MKKFSLILALILCISTFGIFATACDDPDEEFWLETDTCLQTFLDESYESYRDGFDYSDKIEPLIGTVDIYTDITEIYEPVFTASISFLSKYSGVLQVVPTNTAPRIKEMFNNFEKQLKTAEQDINYFAETLLPRFTNGVEGSTEEEATSIISLDYLKNFKRAYINLSTKMLDVTKSFINLYTDAYIDITEKNLLRKNGEYIELTDIQYEIYANIMTTKSMISTLTPYIDYINDFDGKYEQLPSDNYKSIINYYNQIIYNNYPLNITTQEIYEWLISYEDYYLKDLDCFNEALNVVNMGEFKTKYNYNVNDYIDDTNNPTLYAHINKIYDFNKTSVAILKAELNEIYK